MHTHSNFWVLCSLAPSYQALVAGYQMYWSTSTSTHNPLFRLAALTSSKHPLSRGMSLFVSADLLTQNVLWYISARPWLWAEWSHRSLQKQLLLQGHCKICTTINECQYLPVTWRASLKKNIFLSKEFSDWCTLCSICLLSTHPCLVVLW